jgi:hypothetical protein
VSDDLDRKIFEAVPDFDYEEWIEGLDDVRAAVRKLVLEREAFAVKIYSEYRDGFEAADLRKARREALLIGADSLDALAAWLYDRFCVADDSAVDLLSDAYRDAERRAKAIRALLADQPEEK